ncbi:MAG: hypothetical protein WC260_03935 [Candidatus Pacearchaeota archaeon]
MKKDSIKIIFKKIIAFLKEDSWPSTIIFLILAAIFIKFILFPFLSFVTGTSLPLVIVESCSMYHSNKGFENTLNEIYFKEGITLEDTQSWSFKKGLNKGDIIIAIGPKNLKKGDIIIFEGGANRPIIHRLIDDIEPYATKGDNPVTNYHQLENEKIIYENQIIGKAVFRIPSLGWIKLFFFDIFKEQSQRGLC